MLTKYYYTTKKDGGHTTIHHKKYILFGFITLYHLILEDKS